MPPSRLCPTRFPRPAAHPARPCSAPCASVHAPACASLRAHAVSRPCACCAPVPRTRNPCLAPSAPVRAPAAPSCLVLQSQYNFFLYYNTISQPNTAASVTTQKLYRDTISQPHQTSYCNTISATQLYCNTISSQASHPILRDT